MLPAMSDEPIPASAADPARFREALRQFDAANARDPHSELENGTPQPRELLYALRLTRWVWRLCPDASEALALAARCQHLCRWEIPRSAYPLTRPGYLKWRNDLKRLHAEKAGQILRAVGYPETLVERVQALNLKSLFPQDPESRVLEDALCLVFLQFQFADLAAKTEREKVVNALRKSWGKMTEQGRAEALKLPFAPEQADLLQAALKQE